MKIGLYLGEDLLKKRGGAYSYISHLTEKLFEANLSHQFTVITFDSSANLLRIPKEKIISIKINSLLKYILKTFLKLPLLWRLAQKIQAKIITNAVDKAVKKNKIDIIYYLVQECLSLNIPFIITQWDMGHITIGNFPEVKLNGQFEYRKSWQ